MYVNGTKKSKLDFGARLFGQSLEPKPTKNEIAQPGHVQIGGHAPPGPVQIEGHTPSGLGEVSQIEGRSDDAPILKNIRKRKSGPAYGKMGHINPQFKEPRVVEVPAMITQVGGHPKVGGHAKLGGHKPLVPAMVTQVGGTGPKYTASKLSKKGYRMSQSGSQDEGHAHVEGCHAHVEGPHAHVECRHAHDAQLQGYVDSGT